MVEDKVRLLSEGLARSINRRKFLKQTGGTLFASMTALAAGHLMSGSAAAKTLPAGGINCAPPGPYCNLNGVNQPNGCHGGHCFQHRSGGQVLQCRVCYHWYVAGCWTTPTGNGYWTCCDCECGPSNIHCGCAQYRDTSTPPPPLPESPLG